MEDDMARYRIESKAGMVMGIYAGRDESAALAAMHRDGGGAGDAGGTAEDWIIRAVCSGPSCSRPVVAHGLCASHYRQQKLRGEKAPLSPLGPPVGERGEGVRVDVRVATATMKQLRSEGRPATIARRVLDGWAAKR